ncbi:50S ribosomal protein L24 [Candidatus Woesearchaeota archaeon]|nr:50S ribosomal protein L24 [Candidatus Woesearchaeota archaeon]
MKTKFSSQWKRSIQPRKQRKYRYQAPLHVRQRFMRSHLSPELRKKYGKRSIGLRKGDKVKVMRGHYKKQTGKIDTIFLSRGVVYISGVQISRKDGNKVFVPFQPSNLMITELSIEDKKRSGVLERGNRKNPPKAK